MLIGVHSYIVAFCDRKRNGLRTMEDTSLSSRTGFAARGAAQPQVLTSTEAHESCEIFDVMLVFIGIFCTTTSAAGVCVTLLGEELPNLHSVVDHLVLAHDALAAAGQGLA